MSLDDLLAQLQDAVNRRDRARARAMFERLEDEHPKTAADLLDRLAASDNGDILAG